MQSVPITNKVVSSNIIPVARIDNPNKQETFGTPATGQRQAQHKKTQHIILKR
jgi:hypothetical protein